MPCFHQGLIGFHDVRYIRFSEVDPIRNGLVNLDYWVTPRLAAEFLSNLISLCVLRALRGDISLLLKQIRDCGRLH